MGGAACDQLPRYTAKATVFPAPERIEDPFDKRWKEEVEISKLTVSDFDLVWTIDSTGSMANANLQVANETGRVMRALSLVSRRMRCGTIYVRHEVDPALMQQCCPKAPDFPGGYQAKPFPLTAQVDKLISVMLQEFAQKPARAKGTTHPGTAVHSCIFNAVSAMPWSKDAAARRVIVLVGDSEPTPNSIEAAKTLAAQAVANGFHVHALATGAAARTWSPVLEAAKGQMIKFDPKRDPTAAPRRGNRRNADPESTLDPFEQITVTVLRSAVSAQYHDRIDTLAPIVLRFATEMPK